jgi:aspartate oxidase
MDRKESRGLHYTTDYPDRNTALDGNDTVFSILEKDLRNNG